MATKTSGSELVAERFEEAGAEGAESRASGGENVAVMVRCRPLGQAERPAEAARLKVDEPNRCVVLEGRQFSFDQVFGGQVDDERVYMRAARPLVAAAFAGFNCTIFLYGQTGTGKTHTHSALSSGAFAHLFGLIQAAASGARFLIRASYYELYNEQIRDLLAPGDASQKALELRESKARGVYVKGLASFLVSNLTELERLKRLGDRRRSTAATQMNERSSRSHSIFSLTIEALEPAGPSGQLESAQRQRPGSKQPSRPQQANPSAVRLGRLHLIDLAGSERQSKSGSSGARLREASRINLSLTCLALVIRALTDQTAAGQHVPYRNSKLTRLLSSSLGGNSKTLLVACISPAGEHLDETLNTLRFASRTKRIKNVARVNEDPKDALLRNYRRQISELRERLREQELGDASSSPTKGPPVAGSEPQSQQQQQQTKQLMEQLKLLQAKIMAGGENLLEKVELHERLLEASRTELEEKRRFELELAQELERKRTNIEQVAKSRGGLESQRVELEEKLKRAVELFRGARDELRDLRSEHEQLRESLLQSIRATSKEIRYADCIIEDFIPGALLELINTYAHYDDHSDEWQIKYIALSGNNLAQTKRLLLARGSQEEEEEEEVGGQQIDLLAQSSGFERELSTKGQRPKLSSHRTDPYLRF